MKTRFLPNNMHVIHFSGQLGDFYSYFLFIFGKWLQFKHGNNL